MAKYVPIRISKEGEKPESWGIARVGESVALFGISVATRELAMDAAETQEVKENQKPPRG